MLDERVGYHPDVITDIEDILFYIEFELSNLPAADRFESCLRMTSSAIAAAPRAYGAHPFYQDDFPDLRHRVVAGFKKHVIYYHVDESGAVTIVAVLYGPSDHAKTLKERTQ